MKPAASSDLVTFVHPIPESASARAVLEALKRDEVAVLVGSDRRPIGVLTYSDMEHIKKRVAEKAERARELFHAGRSIYTVSVSDDAAAVARAIARHGLKTGIVAVDDQGSYAGYVFVRDLRELHAALSERTEALEKEIDKARKEHPAQFERVDRLVRSGGTGSES
jgi:hypothetical protein